VDLPLALILLAALLLASGWAWLRRPPAMDQPVGTTMDRSTQWAVDEHVVDDRAADHRSVDDRMVDARTVLDLGAPAALELSPEDDLFTLAWVRRRLDILAGELERLERDREVFAKAFHTHAAQIAYQGLLADASRLAAVATLEMEFSTSAASAREELRL